MNLNSREHFSGGKSKPAEKPCCIKTMSLPTNPTWGQAVQLHQNNNFKNLSNTFERHVYKHRNPLPQHHAFFMFHINCFLILTHACPVHNSLIPSFFFLSTISLLSLPIAGKAGLLCQNHQMLFLCRDHQWCWSTSFQPPTNDKWLFALRQSGSFPSTFISDGKFSSFLLPFSMMEFALVRHTDRWSLLTAEIIDDLVQGPAEGRGNDKKSGQLFQI